MAGLSLSKDESKTTDTDKVKFLETVIFPIKQSPSMLVEWALNNFLFDRYQMFCVDWKIKQIRQRQNSSFLFLFPLK